MPPFITQNNTYAPVQQNMIEIFGEDFYKK